MHKRKVKIKILYIKPETGLLGEKAKLQERVCYNVLQQYARSAVFEEIVIVENEKIAECLPEVTLMEYFGSINETIAYSYHMLNVFSNSKTVMDTFSATLDTSRICTISTFTTIAYCVSLT